MPGNLLNADVSFPKLTDEQSTSEKFRLIENYLYMLLEQLRYSFGNIGVENFNDSELDDLINLITEPIYVQLEDDEGNISSLFVTANQLISRMTDAEGNISTLQQTSNSLMSQVSDLEGNVSTLQQTSQSLATRVTDAEGNISSLTQTVNGFTLSVTNGTESSTIRLMSGSAQISSATIQMTGMVTFTDLSGNGTTVINGNNIKTGLIDAQYLNLTGAITFNDLSYSLQNDIDSAYSLASSANSTASSVEDDLELLANGQYQGGTFINGRVIYSPTLMGDQIILMNGNSYAVGYISLQATSTYAFDITSNLSLRLQSAAGYNAYLSNGRTSGSSAASVLLASDGQLALTGNPITISSANYGYNLPSGSQETGRIFFLVE